MFRRVSLSLKLSAAFFVTIVLSVALVYFLTARSVSQRFDTCLLYTSPSPRD